jgi:DNA repair protein RadA/Sms
VAVYHCSVCRFESPAWIAQCGACGRYNSFSVDGGGFIVKSTSLDVAETTLDRRVSGIPIFDEVMGGGLVLPSCVLVAGIAGAGKSTILLQVVGGLAATGLRCVYICAEEEAARVIARGRRIGALHENLDLVRTTDPDHAVSIASGYDLAVYDSIQKLGCTAGMLTAPRTRILVSQLNKQGDVRGERTNEHDPDVLLFCDFNPADDKRILLTSKNRDDELRKAPYTLTGTGAQGFECKKCHKFVMPCACPPKTKKKRGEE